jgi:two-component system alkaline phosphatase synthesis response regulator PhoP
MSKAPQNVLVASADQSLLKNLNSSLGHADYKVIFAADGIEALYLAERSNAGVVVLDSDISKIQAQDIAVLIKKIPRLKQACVILLHPKDYSFEHNGTVDEYMEKPVGGKALAAKIKARSKSSSLKSVPMPISNLKKVIGDLTVDRDSYMVYYKENEILLPRKEFELIYLLASRPEKVFTREEIFKHIWHKDLTPKEGRTIDVHIRKLRSKISEDLITTIKGIGYKIVM